MKSWPLNMKLFVVITTINVTMITIIAVVIYFSNVNEMRRQAESLTTVAATQFSRSIDLYMQDIESLSISLFTDPVIQEGLSNNRFIRTPYEEYILQTDLYTQLFSQSYARRDLEGITIFTKDNIAYEYVNQGSVERMSWQEQPEWYERLDQVEKGTFLLLPTHTYQYMDGQTWDVVSFIRNIYTIPQRNKIGAMKIDVNIDGLMELINYDSVERLQEYMQVYVVDQNSQLVITSNPDYETGDQPNLDDDVFLSTVHSSDYTDWDIYIEINNEFAEYEQWQIITFIFYSGTPVILLTALVSYLLSMQTTKPLRKLTDKMGKVEQGQLHERMSYTGYPEMDVLSRVYNDMLDSINRLIRENYESKLMEKNARILALQSQVNPHFLYNTLNVMKSISRAKKVDEVADISESLAELFKYSMKDPDMKVLLSDELQHIKNYMNIQRYRFMDRYTLNVDVQEHLMDVKVPKLVIQPVVENCMKHGLKNKESDGWIYVTVKEHLNTVKIRIEDNGEGISVEELREINRKLESQRIIETDGESGLGVINTHLRIRLLYGEAYGLKIRNRDEGGTIVMMTIPLEQKWNKERED